MKNYTRLYEDIYFYSKEYEAAKDNLDKIKKSGDRGNALLRAEREVQKLKAKLDALSEELPFEISEKR